MKYISKIYINRGLHDVGSWASDIDLIYEAWQIGAVNWQIGAINPADIIIKIVIIIIWLFVLQIEGVFEYLYPNESATFTSKWEMIADILIDRLKTCKDLGAVTLLAILKGDGQDKTKSIAGN